MRWQIGMHVGQASLLAWVLWAQPYGLTELNDQVMVESPAVGPWRYRDGFDQKSQCQSKRSELITAQQTTLAGLTQDADLSKLRYYVYKCYPESLDPTRLTRDPFE